MFSILPFYCLVGQTQLGKEMGLILIPLLTQQPTLQWESCLPFPRRKDTRKSPEACTKASQTQQR